MNTDNANPASVAGLPAAAISALQRGNKIEAIKIVRADRNLDLKGAKDAVEAYVEGQPALQSSLATMQAAGNRGALRWVIVIILLGMVAYHFLAK